MAKTNDDRWPKGRSETASFEELTKPVWRLACHAWYRGMDEISAFNVVLATFGDDFGDECCRLTVANLYESSRRFSIYWKDNSRRYKVTKREKSTEKLTCPRCKGIMKPRKVRTDQHCLQCKGCGFSISPQDLVWDDPQPTGEEVLPSEGQQLPEEQCPEVEEQQ
ncbi:hypothetical protein LCGC14_2953400 [marine sediment metagenome]|uniref:Uncharacterized protein n=1 Tax=marine sediment metagenome TaxID=412755 RepID=A0A0F8Y1T0_9ZZZZ